jgi:PadR family transcriptional regulator PadR
MNRHRQEMRRGSLVMVVLILLKEEHYGYSLRKKLMSMGIEIEEGTLYPMIRRLADNGFLNSHWLEADGRRKRYYLLSGEGKVLLLELTEQWQAINNMLEKVMA